MVVESK